MNKEEVKIKEIERLYNMSEYERKYKDFSYIAGVDEVGRGPFAGPVVASVVILKKDETILYLNDSKKLSEKKRDLLFDEICKKAIAFGIGMATSEEIDEINILNATHLAMKRAIEDLTDKFKIVPDILLVDALKIKDVDILQEPIIKGDAKSVSIAAASIVAKVTRDRYMIDLDSKYPIYGFSKHKGYGTAYHINAIKENGIIKEHRKTFLKKYLT